MLDLLKIRLEIGHLTHTVLFCFLSFIILLHVGCTTIDKIPKGHPKGYVEFYITKEANYSCQIGVYQRDKRDSTKLRRVGRLGVWSRYDRLRIAAASGLQDYYLLLWIEQQQKNFRNIKVDVFEDKVTPIGITITRIATERKYSVMRGSVVKMLFTVDFAIGTPIPISGAPTGSAETEGG